VDKYRGAEAAQDRRPSGDFPVRIEGYDCRIYEYDEDALAPLPSGLLCRAYAERYKWFRSWPKSDRSITRKIVSAEKVSRAVWPKAASDETVHQADT
jgi:hypothetical protein